MNIYIKRIYTDLKKYTVGQLWIDGVFVCDTLEDPERNLPDVCPYTPKWQNCKCKEKVYADIYSSFADMCRSPDHTVGLWSCGGICFFTFDCIHTVLGVSNG